jgi:hypothetical protein
MPNFVSVLGKWLPRKEVVTLTNTFGKTLTSDLIVGPSGSHTVKVGEVFIYSGPNREAVKMLKADGVDFLGRDFRTDPEFLQAVRNMGFQSVKEYLKWMGFEEEKEIAKQMALVDVLCQEKPETQAEILELAGGRDFTGNKANNFIGGFGPERLRSADEVKSADK